MAVTNRKKSQPIKSQPKSQSANVTQKDKGSTDQTKDETSEEEIAKSTAETLREFAKMALYALMITAIKAVIKFAYPDTSAMFNWQKSAVITWAILMVAQTCLYLSNVFSKQKKSSGLVGGLAAVGASLGYHAIAQQ